MADGLFNKLVTQNSNLRLLKFGKDLPGAGTSRQPYVTKPLPGVEDPLPTNSPDFLLRQGTLQRIADDETRFFKYFTSTQGLAFIAKQNLLSLTSVRTQASQGPSNQGTYLPTNTSAQLAANPFGGHLNFLGVDPTGLLGGIRKYGDLVNPPLGIGDIAEADNNRLVSLSKDLGFISREGEEPENQEPGRLRQALQKAREFLSNGKTTLFSYSGGPGSAEGIGQTNIYRYSFTPTNTNIPSEGPGILSPLGVSNSWFTFTQLVDSVSFPELITGGGVTFNLDFNTSVYKSGSLKEREGLNTYLVGKQHSGLEELKENRFGEESTLKVTNGVSDTYNQLTNFSLSQATDDYYGVVTGDSSPTLRNSFSVYKSGSLDKREDLNTYLVGKKHGGLEELKENRFDSSSLKVTNGVSDTYNQLTNFSLSQATDDYYGVIEGNSSPTLRNSTSVYKSGSLDKREDLNTYLVGKQHTPDDPDTFIYNPLRKTDIKQYNNQSLYAKGDKDILSTSRTEVWNSKTIANESLPTNTGEIREDFRKKLRNAKSTLPIGGLEYSGNKALDKRLNQGTPGARGNITNYTSGKKDESGNNLYK